MLPGFDETGVGPSSLKTNFELLRQILGGLGEPSKIVLFDDFLGGALDSRWSGASGADGSNPAISSAVGGTVDLASGGGTTDMAANLSALTHGLNFDAGNGDVLMRARVKIDNKANSYMFVGLTDVLATGTAELPFELDASDALTSNASDAVGFLYDTTGSDAWFVAGVAGDTDAGPSQLGVSPTNGEYVELEVRVTDSGTAKFYIDGQHKADLASAVSTGTALTPIVACSDDNTASRTMSVDWITVVGER